MHRNVTTLMIAASAFANPTERLLFLRENAHARHSGHAKAHKPTGIAKQRRAARKAKNRLRSKR